MRRGHVGVVAVVLAGAALVCVAWSVANGSSPDTGAQSLGVAAQGANSVVRERRAPARRVHAPVEEPTEDVEDASATTSRVFEILVLDETDAPIADVDVVARGCPEVHRTGGDGIVRLTAVPTQRVVVAGIVDVALVERRSIVRLGAAIALHATVVDADTGASLPDAEVTLRSTRSDRAVPLRREADDWVLDRAPATRGDRARWTFEVAPPAAYAAAAVEFSMPICRWTSRVDVQLPLHRELPVTIEAVWSDGLPAADMKVIELAPIEAPGLAASPTDACGRTVLHGVPWLRGERISVHVGEEGADLDEGEARSAWSDPVTILPGLGVTLHVVIPRERGTPSGCGSSGGGGVG